MGNNISEVSTMQQSVVNNIVQDQASICRATCGIDISGNTIVVNGGTVDTIGITTNGCQVSASCLISQSMESQVSDILSSISQQSASAVTDFMNDLSLYDGIGEDIDIRQSVTNNLTQIASATCEADAITTITNNFIYAQDVNSKLVGIAVNGQTASATCTINNSSKATVYNNMQAKADQSASISGMLAAFAAVFAIVLVLGGLLLIVLFSARALGKKPTPAGATPGVGAGGLNVQDMLQAEIAALSS